MCKLNECQIPEKIHRADKSPCNLKAKQKISSTVPIVLQNVTKIDSDSFLKELILREKISVSLNSMT